MGTSQHCHFPTFFHTNYTKNETEHCEARERTRPKQNKLTDWYHDFGRKKCLVQQNQPKSTNTSLLQARAAEESDEVPDQSCGVF